MSVQNTRLGIWLMIATTLVFSMQDSLSRYLGGAYNPLMVVMIRYWFFAAFVIAIAARSPGGLRRARAARHPWLQTLRGLLLVAEICVMVVSFVALGLVATHVVFTAYPLLVAALSGPVLGERVGWRRWLAIGLGFVGIIIILRPGVAVFSPLAALPLLAALMFAIYGLLTRYVSRADSSEVSFFWTGTTGAIAITAVGIWFWEPLAPTDWWIMGALCVAGILGHYLLIRAYEVAEASAVQPFAYFQLVFVSLIGVGVLGETVDPQVIAGSAIVVGAGLFTLWRSRVHENNAQTPPAP